jgi:hypothetical protein
MLKENIIFVEEQNKEIIIDVEVEVLQRVLNPDKAFVIVASFIVAFNLLNLLLLILI